ncbi:MAG: DUF2232 domain-containing protein [Deltaproteobacteria bacterium]|nr:DUF2232 domain-containing protein [Deltaproteobacteria bacterium]
MGRRVWQVVGASAATLLLLTGGEFAAFLALLVHLLLPFPAAWVHMVHGPAAGGSVVGLSVALFFLYSGIGAAGGYLLQFGIGSFCLPWLLRRNWPWDRAVVVTLAVVAIGSAVVFGAVAFQQGKGINGLAASQVEAQLAEGKRLSEATALSLEQRAELEAVLEWGAGFIRRAYPALALVSHGMILLFVVLLLNRAPGVKGLMAGSEFRHWSVSPWLIWFLIAGGFGFVLGRDPVQTVALNLLVVVVPIYFLQGLAIVAFFFWKKSVGPWVRGLGYFMAVTLNPLPMLVTGLGIFDLWIGFRKPRIREKE